METVKKTDAQMRIAMRRKMLKDLSRKAREYRDNMVNAAAEVGNEQEFEKWTMATVNEVILDIYRQQTGAKVFHSYKHWKEAGYFVERGSKAFVVWGKKRTATNEQRTATNETQGKNDDVFKFFPIAYVFSDLQVKPKEPQLPLNNDHLPLTNDQVPSTNEQRPMNIAQLPTEQGTKTNEQGTNTGKFAEFEEAFSA